MKSFKSYPVLLLQVGTHKVFLNFLVTFKSLEKLLFKILQKMGVFHAAVNSLLGQVTEIEQKAKHVHLEEENRVFFEI
jgi:hypothetical protein